MPTHVQQSMVVPSYFWWISVNVGIQNPERFCACFSIGGQEIQMSLPVFQCKPFKNLSFTACFPQIPCNHGSVIKRADFLFCATFHFPVHTTEEVFD